MQSSMLQFSTFLLSAIVLVHLDVPKTALAIPGPPGPLGPPGPNRRFPTPLQCDYPDDDTIRSNFIRPDPDQTVDFADLNGPPAGPLAEFCLLYDVRWVYDCFPDDYCFKGERSERWFIDFYYRFNVIYLQAARGWVYLLSRGRPSRLTRRMWVLVSGRISDIEGEWRGRWYCYGQFRRLWRSVGILGTRGWRLSPSTT